MSAHTRARSSSPIQKSVWIVSGGEKYGGSNVCGAFSTQQRAIEWVEKEEMEKGDHMKLKRANDTMWCNHSYFISIAEWAIE